MKYLEKYSFGVGDRFGRQGRAQLRAVMMAADAGVDIVPVWNKSHREHSTTGTQPAGVRAEADAAVKALDWQGSYYVDADHIGAGNVGLFMDACDFYTLDVANFIGKKADESDIDAFVRAHSELTGSLEIDGIDEPLVISEDDIRRIAGKVLLAVKKAAAIYRIIKAGKGEGNFITEVSMDETDMPQRPVEMLFILAAIADEGIPAQTIAPKFTGRFNKGVDYVGDVEQFALEFEQDLAVIDFAVKRFGLPANLKLSVHSGSDKFSIYKPIKEAIKKFDAGLHLKTAGTTWLEEVIGLAKSGGDGLVIAKEIYQKAYARFDELCGPYASVIDIDRGALPVPDEVNGWSGEKFAATLAHEPDCPDYDPNLRQLVHVGYKVAAEMGGRYLDALKDNEDIIAEGVTDNIFRRHINAIFMD
jgi:tagaturonate epimerase